MKNICDISYETICKLITESEWGKSVTNEELFGFLFDEAYELIDGCNKNNRNNMLEEASDVLMILLYIVIKNVDDRQNNQIEILLDRLNQKLQTRYAMFFNEEQSDGEEEKNWKQTKYLEKEILGYIYCPNPDCDKYAETERGNLEFDDEYVKCNICGYTAKCSNHNMILYTSKHRREMFKTIDMAYVGFSKGMRSYADDFFNSHLDEYLKIMRYWILDSTKRYAVDIHFAYRHNEKKETFDEFLMHPLRNCLKNILCHKKKLLYSFMKINDLIIKCINVNYMVIRDEFYGNGHPEYLSIWKDYIFYLIKTIVMPVEYDLNNMASSKEPLSYGDEQNISGNVLKGFVVWNQDIKSSILLRSFSSNGNESIVEADLTMCKSNIQVGQLIVSVFLKFNLQNMQKLKCIFSGLRGNLDKQEITEFLTDVLPMLKSIEYL